MIIRNTIPLRWLLFYKWKSLVILTTIAVLSAFLKEHSSIKIYIPVSVTAMFSAALSIYLGFRSNNAYDRWWEARIIWGALINDSRSWGRQVCTLIGDSSSEEETLLIKKELIYRHIAFVNALRIMLRGGNSIAHEQTKEIFTVSNDIRDLEKFLDKNEYEKITKAINPPNMLLQAQGERIVGLYKKGLLTDYRLVYLESTLVEFSNVQGKSERIKNTAFPRSYSYFQRIFVWTHGVIIPFAYVTHLGWGVLPIAFILNYVFLTIDFISSRTEDPFENRMDDVPLTSICNTIERNLREVLGETNIPDSYRDTQGILL